MKKLTHLFGILMLTFLTITATQAQDVSLEHILKNYFENIGGEAAWKKIKSIKITGNTTAQGMTMPITIKMMAPNYFKMEMDFQGKAFIQAYDGKQGWMMNPFMGATEPQKMDEEQSKEFEKQKFQDEFIDYKEKGHKVELVGKEEIDGTETYKIKMTKKNGDVVFYFFDTENFVPIMQRALLDYGPMKGQSVETYMSDYQEVDGLMVAFTTEQKMGGNTAFSMTAEKVEFNVEDIKPETFAFPEKK
ncbi:MAG TPA: outer membrane lipoprotein-sorting protein [Phaeodactylibacter sp.]|nr:outer membrane lipoprotein-sorting protein [Phaeodactylibacter sp.]